MLNTSEENYLKVIYKLEKEAEGGVSTNSLSEVLDTKAASVTKMIQKLASKDLADHTKYYGVELTELGKKLALAIIRKHRLWESFLVERMDFNWCEVHEVAEQLEHVQSEKLIDAIDRLLGYPKADPHGDPIPDKDGNLDKIDKILLSDCQVGTAGILIGVKDTSAIILRYLDKQEIALGARFKLNYKEAFDNALDIQINEKQLRLSHKMASNLYVDVS